MIKPINKIIKNGLIKNEIYYFSLHTFILNSYLKTMSELKTKITFDNPEDKKNSGFTIENPYADKIRFITDSNEEGFIEIPKITVFGILNFLYVGEATARDGRCGFRSRAVSELNYWFDTKKTFKFWRKALRPLYDQILEQTHKEVKKDMDF